jgi:UDP-N-acetylmuramyl pentapeptide phosphotransferase/UDP-N-acetylglucosamine-1-phosphate transferase
VDWLPLALASIVALWLTPELLRLLSEASVVRENYRGAVLPAAGGAVILVAALLALAPLAALDELAGADTLRADLGDALVYVLGVGVLGLLDDLLGGRVPAGAERAGAPRGWRGHARAVARGRPTTGAIKAVGSLGLALYVLGGAGQPAGEYLAGVAVLVLATNLFNLLDLRPGRAGKAFLALGLTLTIVMWDTGPLRTLGIFIGPALVLLPFDLRERAMLGDVGSNVLGALAGIWLVLELGAEGEAVAAAVLVLLTVYAEFRSISALVEKNPLLRRLDSLGRQRKPPNSPDHAPLAERQP